ncbi:hypothetical protein [Streptomyces sp. NBC_00696]|uniref:hypothetical protein n=1 Tax=Streptomyces sp. NBC_00696 TaxID=2903672 RepID=UPI002E2FF35B|nr:hypothetical protein [Streptomyces sp. NBC_00696]
MSIPRTSSRRRSDPPPAEPPAEVSAEPPAEVPVDVPVPVLATAGVAPNTGTASAAAPAAVRTLRLRITKFPFTGSSKRSN